MQIQDQRGLQRETHLNKTSKQKTNRKEKAKAMVLLGCEEGKFMMHVQSSA